MQLLPDDLGSSFADVVCIDLVPIIFQGYGKLVVEFHTKKQKYHLISLTDMHSFHTGLLKQFTYLTALQPPIMDLKKYG